MKSPAPSREKFEQLRTKYLVAREKWTNLRISFELRYGGRFQTSWLKAGERNKLDALANARDRVGDTLFAYIQAVSPRDWSHGVPSHWILEELSYEDVVRPRGEKLSVVPPLSFMSTHQIT